MTAATMKDGAKIYFKDLGTGPVVTFSHGLPLTADAWDAQMLFLANHGYRVIAHDRRSHGRSDQTWTGNDMDTYADDLATLLEALDVKGATMIGHSTGGGEVARCVGRHAPWYIACVESSPDFGGASAYGADAHQPQQCADERLRRPALEPGCRSGRVLQRTGDAVLWLQPP
ncbi:pimeloyl-ACP methyl ester carboxylesterase [Bradyrhizobium sp. LB7.1]